MWYAAVVKDTNNLSKALQYYEREVKDAIEETIVPDEVSPAEVARLNLDLPGIIAYRRAQYYEIEAIVKYLDILLIQAKSNTVQNLVNTSNRALTQTEARQYADGDQNVVDLAVLINEVVLVKNKFGGVVKSLDTKGFQLGHAVALMTRKIVDDLG